MNRFGHYGYCLGLVLLGGAVLCSLSCAGRSQRNLDEDSIHSSSSVTILFNKMDSLLERGKQDRLEGAYSEATKNFETVYANTQASIEQRAEALFELGAIFSDLHNPDKSYQQAIGYFKKLISEFPQSPLVKRTKDRIKETLKFSR